MSDFPQDVYARNLPSHHGYPLRTPEPAIELPDIYKQEGLKIGDVGVVDEHGSFDVFFNITLPREHPLHAPNGVPNNFAQVELKRDDYRIVPDAMCSGCVITSPGVGCEDSCIDPFEVHGDARSLIMTDHQFSLCQNEGAMLILPEGAERHRLVKELLLLDVVLRNAVDWYRFARELLYRNIRDDALYLVTGFHKAYSWSLASFQNTGASSAQCKLVQLRPGGPILTAHSSWKSVRPLEWRIGPKRHSDGTPNQSVFITGFKIAINEELLYLKRVTVKVDHTKRTLATKLVGFGASLANVLVGETSGGIHSPETTTQNEAGDQSTTDHDEHADGHEHVTVERVPHLSQVKHLFCLLELWGLIKLQPFHPSDIINRYLLTKEPSAMLAVTHDSQWINLLEKGILRPEELMQEGRLEAVVSREYHIVTKYGAVYLEPETSSLLHAPIISNSSYSSEARFTGGSHTGWYADEDFTPQDAETLHQYAALLNQPQPASYPCRWMTGLVACDSLVQVHDFPDHLRSHHGVTGSDQAILICRWVGCSTVMKGESLMRHVNERHLELKYTCPICAEQFTRLYTMQNHMSRKHSRN